MKHDEKGKISNGKSCEMCKQFMRSLKDYNLCSGCSSLSQKLDELWPAPDTKRDRYE